MSLIAVLGIILIVLALVHIVPFVLGIILGVVLIIAGGGWWYGHRGGPPL